MKKQNGFTLIELVVVIVILAILAATAAPKFMDLQKDARISAAQGLVGALKSSVSMTYSKAILAGKDKSQSGAFICASGSMKADKTACSTTTEQVDLVYGRPAGTATGIINAIDLDVSEYSATATTDWTYKAGTAGTIYIMQKGSAEVTSDTAGCGVSYTQSANATSSPVIKVVDTDC